MVEEWCWSVKRVPVWLMMVWCCGRVWRYEYFRKVRQLYQQILKGNRRSLSDTRIFRPKPDVGPHKFII